MTYKPIKWCLLLFSKGERMFNSNRRPENRIYRREIKNKSTPFMVLAVGIGQA